MVKLCLLWNLEFPAIRNSSHGEFYIQSEERGAESRATLLIPFEEKPNRLFVKQLS